jgi:ribosomal protein S12 methylthiotransferase accessory factor
MFGNPDLVRTMEDHALVNCLPESRQRFSFLLDQNTEPIPFRDACALTRVAAGLMPGDLKSLVERVLGIGLDVIVVDQTAPELSGSGLVCVKVIVPGFLPMTFGHRFRRLRLQRVVSAAIERRYRSEIRSPSEIGVLPHPFP